MADKPVSVMLFGQHSSVVGSTAAQVTAYQASCGGKLDAPDIDFTIASGITSNTQNPRRLALVQNGSGGTIACGQALEWVSGQWGVQVQPCVAGHPIRCFAPASINGASSNTIANLAFFYAVFSGYTSVLSDGTAIAVNDGLVVGGTTGDVRTDFGIGGGEVFSAIVASTVLTNTTVATKYDQNYTFPVRSLHAGDTIRMTGEISIPSGNSTDTLATDIMLGTQVIVTLAAFDPTNGGGDIIDFTCNIEIRTDGASGTMVAWGQFEKNVNGTTTVVEWQLASTAIDTTAVQQAAIRGTWSVASASDQSRLDAFNIVRINTTAPNVHAVGSAMAVAASGSPVLFRASVLCNV